MKVEFTSKREGIVVIPVFSEKKKIGFFSNQKDAKLRKAVIENAQIFGFKGLEQELMFFTEGKKKFLAVGVKKDFSAEDIRRSYSVVYDFLKSKKEQIAFVEILEDDREVIASVIEGLDLSDYEFNKYVSKKEKFDLKILMNIPKKFEAVAKEVLKVNRNVKFTRDIVNENSNVQTPKKFEEQAKEFAKKNKLKIKVLNEKQIQKEKLNLLWAVGGGSEHPPRLIIVEYEGDKKSKEKIALVGKGITFDTGGINLKPTGHLEDMKSDMGGAATMFGAFKSAVELKLKKNLILVMSCAENAISSKAYKPGDIFVSYKGISVEIANTDAEGRLVLVDALSYTQKYYKPTNIIDAATLTGASLVALGPSLIAMLGNDEKMKKSIFASGEKTFDRVWELPIYDEHRDMIKGTFSDLKNVAVGGARSYGGTITAAAFLEKFIDEKVKWVHLDIAGAARSLSKNFYVSEFGTGRGVRLLVDYLKNN